MLDSILTRALDLLRANPIALAAAWGGTFVLMFVLRLAMGPLPAIVAILLSGAIGLAALALAMTTVVRVMYFGDDVRTAIDAVKPVAPKALAAWAPALLVMLLSAFLPGPIVVPLMLAAALIGTFLVVEVAIDGSDLGIDGALASLKQGEEYRFLIALLVGGIVGCAITVFTSGIPVVNLLIPSALGAALLSVAVAAREELDVTVLAKERSDREWAERHESKEDKEAKVAAAKPDLGQRAHGGEFSANLSLGEVGGTWAQVENDGWLQVSSQSFGPGTLTLNLATQGGEWIPVTPEFVQGRMTITAQVPAGWYFVHVMTTDATDVLTYEIEWTVPGTGEAAAAAQPAGPQLTYEQKVAAQAAADAQVAAEAQVTEAAAADNVVQMPVQPQQPAPPPSEWAQQFEGQQYDAA